MAKEIKVKRTSLTVQVADALRELILNGDYKQGEQLRQDDLAKKLGVSRIPVREAFQQLEGEGLIINVPYKGAVVTMLSIEEIAEYHDIRISLEGELLETALDNMAPDIIQRARKTINRMKTASPNKWGQINWQLHSDLYTGANRPVTVELIKKIHDNLDRYVRLELSLSDENRQRAHEEHTRLVDLCEQGKKQEAVAHLRRHISSAKKSLIAYMEDMQA